MAQWVPQNSGATSWLNSIYFTDANTGYVVGEISDWEYHYNFYKTIDAGMTWTGSSAYDDWCSYYSVFFTDFDTGYAVGEGMAFARTIDAGTT